MPVKTATADTYFETCGPKALQMHLMMLCAQRVTASNVFHWKDENNWKNAEGLSFFANSIFFAQNTRFRVDRFHELQLFMSHDLTDFGINAAVCRLVVLCCLVVELLSSGTASIS